MGCCAGAPLLDISPCCFAVPEEPCGASPAAGELPRRSLDQAWQTGRASRGATEEGHCVRQPLETLHPAAVGDPVGAPQAAGAAAGHDPGRGSAQEQRQAAQQLLQRLQLLLDAAASDSPAASRPCVAPALPAEADAVARTESAAASAKRCSDTSTDPALPGGFTTTGVESAEAAHARATLACAAGGSAESIVAIETPMSSASLADGGNVTGSQGRGAGSSAGAEHVAASPLSAGMLGAHEAVLTWHEGALPDAAGSEHFTARAGQAPAEAPFVHQRSLEVPALHLRAAAAEPAGARAAAALADGPAAAPWTSRHALEGAPPSQKVTTATCT